MPLLLTDALEIFRQMVADWRFRRCYQHCSHMKLAYARQPAFDYSNPTDSQACRRWSDLWNNIELDFRKLRLRIYNAAKFDPSTSASLIKDRYTQSTLCNLRIFDNRGIGDEIYLLAAARRIGGWYVGMLFRNLQIFGDYAYGEPIGSLMIHEWVDETKRWEGLMALIPSQFNKISHAGALVLELRHHRS
jgi:hypothetical protein